MKAAAYLYNRTPSKSTLGGNGEELISPITSLFRELGTGCFSPLHHMEYRHLRAYGCRAFVHIPKDMRVQSQKLAERAEKGLLVGYEGNSIYRIWLPHKRRVQRSSSVKFLEDSLPAVATTGTYIDIDHNWDPAPPYILDIELNSPGHIKNSEDSDSDGLEIQSINKAYLNAVSDRPNQAHLADIGTYNEAITSPQRRTFEIRVPSPTNRIVPDVSMRDIRSSRNKAPNYTFAAQVLDEPQSYLEAMASTDAPQWRAAIEEEVKALLDNKTWVLVDPPKDGTRILGGKYVFKKKLGPNDQILRYKARWVAKGYLQREGIDYLETTANVVRMEAWRILVAIATIYDFDIEQMDVVTAFLNGKMDVELYMEQPEGYETPNKVCRMLRTLYGLKQSGNIWCSELDTQLVKMGFTALLSDQCVYV